MNSLVLKWSSLLERFKSLKIIQIIFVLDKDFSFACEFRLLQFKNYLIVTKHGLFTGHLQNCSVLCRNFLNCILYFAPFKASFRKIGNRFEITFYGKDCKSRTCGGGVSKIWGKNRNLEKIQNLDQHSFDSPTDNR